MNTLTGYSKSRLTNDFVLTAAGGHLAVGNADKNIPLNNSTLNTNLNADLLDGKHASNFYEKTAADEKFILFSKASKSTVEGTNNSPHLFNIENEELISRYKNYWYVINLGSYSGGGYRTQIAMPYQNEITDTDLFIRSASGSSWRSWRRVLHDNNYTAYTVTKTGGGASGTWGINITGNAASATTATGSSYTRYVQCPDTRSTAFDISKLDATTSGVSFDFKKQSITGLSADFSGVMTYRPYSSESDWTGGPAHLLAFDVNGIHHRTYNSSGFTTWKTLAFKTDIPTVTNYYWANIKIKSAEDKTTVPTFGGINSTGTITDSSTQPLAFTSTGTGVYTRAALIHNTSGTVFERARATESSSGTILPFIISLRGGGTAASFEGNNLYIAGKVGIGTNVSTSALDVKGNVIFQNNTNLVTFELKGPNSKLAMLTWSDSNYIESGNSDFSKNLPLKLTGIAGGLGSDLYLNFANIYCRAGYTNIDSNNYTTYTVKKDGTGASGTWGISISGNAATASNSSKLNSLSTIYNRLCYNLKSVTMSTTLTVWYIKIVLSAYALPCQFMIGGSYNNQIDRAIIETSGMSLGYIYRNCNQNGGNITGVWHKTNYDSSEKVWIFWIRLRGIDNSSSHYAPSSSATYTVYMGESNGSFSVTATTTAPSGAEWTNAAGGGNNSIIIKNGTLYGTASSATNADTLDGYHASAFQLAGDYLINHGMSNSRPNGTTFTLPGGSNGVSMRSKATSGNDIGIFLLTDDNAFICNSSDNNYLFATFDTDKTADFSTASNAAFAVLSDHAGVSIKGLVTMDGYFNIRSHYFFVRDNANADWVVTDKSWKHEYAVIHSGNIGSQSVNYATSAGSASSASSANVATEARVLCADGTMKLYANHSNEINFGGSNTSSTIYFGYRATDSKPIPTSFVFGDSTGSATITSSGFKKKGSSDSYVLLGGGGHKTESSLSVSYASSAGSASSASSATDSDKLDGYHESSFFRYRGVLTSNANFNNYYNGSYVNTTGNGSGNSNNPISYGYLVSFPGAGSSAYYAGWQFSTSTTGLQFRGHWNYAWSSWITVITNQNIGSLSVNYASSAGSVAWGNVTGKPSFFSGNYNDLTNKPTSLPANGGTATAAYYVYDYNATTTPIYIGYAGAGLSTATHFAAYGTTSSGARCIKDLSVANAKSLLGIPTVYARDIGVNGNNWTFYSSTNAATTSIYAPTSVGSSYQILVSSGSTSYPTPYWENRMTSTFPGIIWIGYIYRSTRSSTYWYASRAGGNATVSMAISLPTSSNNYLVALQSSTHTILGGMCSIQAQFNAGKDGGQSTEGPLYAYSTVDVSKIEEAGPDVFVTSVYGGKFYIKAIRASDANNSSYYLDGLAFTSAGKDTNSLPLARINVILFGY